jgi:hypothetical protein
MGDLSGLVEKMKETTNMADQANLVKNMMAGKFVDLFCFSLLSFTLFFVFVETFSRLMKGEIYV